jgi:dimethylamine monooxygenase subunit A
MASGLADLFPDEDYRFHLTLRRGEPAEFFRSRDPTGAEIAERRRWIAEEPARHTALAPAAAPLLDELRALAPAWGLASFDDVRGLGVACEPDVVLLARDADGRFRLQGGALVFPSGWALEEKLGRTVGDIHGIVPGLNDALGATIDRFLAKITPGPAYLRSNWGLAAHAERNAHPARDLPPPALPVTLDRLWLRIEHQALIALPRTGGLVFGIRIVLHRLDAAVREPGFAAGFARALRTMPPGLAAYKRIDAISGVLAVLMEVPPASTKT